MSDRLNLVCKTTNRLLKAFRLRLWQLVLFSAFAVTLLVAAHTPIYTDEVGWKIMTARLFIDGGVNITQYPWCGPPFAMEPAWFMVPVRWFDAWLYADLAPPIKLRLLGIFQFVVWVGVVAWMLPKALAVRMSRMTVTALTLAFMGLGVLPLLLVVNRPEQLLLFSLTVVFLLPFTATPSDSGRRQIGRAAVLTSMVAIAFSYHPKALAFLPLIVTAWILSTKSGFVRAITGFILCFLVAGTFSYWSEHMACPDHPATLATLAKYGGLVSVSDILLAPVDTVKLMLRNVVRVAQYPYFVLFVSQNNLDLFVPATMQASIWALLVDVLIVGFGASLLVMASYAVWSGSLRGGPGSQGGPRRFAAPLAMAVSILGLAALQTHKNFYETSLVVPLIAMALFVALPGDTAARWPFATRRIVQGILALSLISQVALWGEFSHYAASGERESPYVRGLWGAISSAGYQTVRANVLETAEMCAIPTGRELRHLVVDDLTYIVFAETYQPYHLMYLTRDLTSDLGRNTKGLEGFLRERGSAGVIAGCRWFPSGLKDRFVRNGDFCCLPAFSTGGSGPGR